MIRPRIKPRIKDVPNLLSALRLLAAPFAAWLILDGHDIAAVLTFAAAGASDGLDGFIARRWGLTSRFGAWLDPAADKLLMLLCFAALFVVGRAPLWLVAVVMARDLAIAAGWLLVKLFSLPVAISGACFRPRPSHFIMCIAFQLDGSLPRTRPRAADSFTQLAR